jgi:enamine deaminase RidA (YjgF/YER057c/UK114 family)
MDRLARLYTELPTPVTPLGNYVAGVQVGKLLFLSGHGPLRDQGIPAFKGVIGCDYDLAQGASIIRGASLNALSSANRILGKLENIKSIVRANIFLVCTEDVDAKNVCGPTLELLNEVSELPPFVLLPRVRSLPNRVPALVELTIQVRH